MTEINEIDNSSFVGAVISFHGDKRRWRIGDMLVLPRDIETAEYSKMPFYLFAMPARSRGSDRVCRVVFCDAKVLTAKVVKQGFVLYLNEARTVSVFIKKPNPTEIAGSD